MHILFVHQNFPAQFGHIAHYLAERHGCRCTFVSEKPAGRVGAIDLVQYRIQGSATRQTHYCSRTFENAIWHTHAVYQALHARPDLRPDLVVGHSGFGSTLFLRDLYTCPIINYFEYFYRPSQSDMDFRPDFPRANWTNSAPVLAMPCFCSIWRTATWVTARRAGSATAYPDCSMTKFG